MDITFNYIAFDPNRTCWSESKQKYFRVTENRFIKRDHPNTPARCETLPLTEVLERSKVNIDRPKTERDMIQVMSTEGHFALKDYDDMSHWNGCIFIDLDFDKSKLWESVSEEKRRILYDTIADTLFTDYMDNALYIETSSHGGIHVLFYYDVEKTQENHFKCARYTKDLFFGELTKRVGGLDKVINEHGVFDEIYTRPYQVCYITTKNARVNEFCSGAVNMSVLDRYAEEKQYTRRFGEGGGDTKFDYGNFNITIQDCSPEYISHTERWVLFRSLFRIYGDTKELREQWERCSSIMVEANGHTCHYYKEIPWRGDWYRKAKEADINTIYIDFGLLEMFGYKIKQKITRSQYRIKKLDELIESL